MSIKYRSFLLLLLFILLPLGGLFGKTQLRRPMLRWRPVRGAAAYQVELKYRRGRVFFRRRTTRTWMYVYLKPGYYLFRVSVVNRFKKIESSSRWALLVIRRAPWPVLTRVDPETVRIKGEKKIKLTVYGKKFKRRTRLELSGNGRTWRPENQKSRYSRKKGRYIVAELKTDGLTGGEYAVRAVTPVKIFSRKSKTFFIRRDGIAGLTGVEFLTGGGWQWPLGEWSDRVASSPLWQCAVEYRLNGIRPLSGIPVINMLRIGVLFQMSSFGEQPGNIAKSTLQQRLLVPYLGTGLRLDDRLSLQLRAGFGWGFSSLHSETSTSTEDLDSSDPLLFGSAAVRWDFNWWLFAEAGVDYTRAFMIGKALQTLQPVLRFGIRL